MKKNKERSSFSIAFSRWLVRMGIGLRAKLMIEFLMVKVIPLLLLTVFAWSQISAMGGMLREIAVSDSSAALNDSAVENIERMTTDTAADVADFLYGRDDDILYLASVQPSLEGYSLFAQSKTGRVVQRGQWALSADESEWVDTEITQHTRGTVRSTNAENNDMDGFHYVQPTNFTYKNVPLYDEITFIDLKGQEQIKYVSPNSTKTNYPMDTALRDVSRRQNTYIHAETYFEKLQSLQPGEIYVSDVIGAYVGSNYIGMYTPGNVATAAEDRGYDIAYDPEAQAYAGEENPNGQRFEGIVRWATPVAGADGKVVGYVTFALNHDHIMEFVDHLTPMNERYTELPSAYEGNYAFIWDYKCRSICHPRHNSIVGYDPETGLPQVPWLEQSIYDGWQASGEEYWGDYVADIPVFDNQSREKKPAAALTQAGLVGLDGRYLNNAPQCTGWMDLTEKGGSGSFYILWSGIYKLTTAAAIPYYTGQYAPGEENNYSLRGFGFVTIGAGLEDFTRPATETGEKLGTAIQDNLRETSYRLAIAAAGLILVVMFVAFLISSSITGNIRRLIDGISRFRAGERQFRFHAPVKDEFGTLADSFDDMADSLVASSTNPLSITDMDHMLIYMNEPGLAFCGVTLEDVVGTHYGDFSVYPEGGKYDPILALEEGREAEVYYLEEQDIYLRGNANYFYSKDGEKIGYIVESVDMTEMVRESIRIEQQRTLLNEVFSASPDLIWYMDAEGNYLTVNPRFAAIAGKEPEAFVGQNAAAMLPNEIADRFGKADREATEGGVPLYTEQEVLFADGHRETLDSVRTPIYNSAGALTGLLGFARDVTVRVRMDQELRSTQLDLEEAVNAANRANEHKGEFLARMSHEIRTPMNAVIGLTSIVQRKLEAAGEGGSEVSGYMDQIEASSQHLLGLLNDILDISKIEAGKIELTPEPVELLRLADTVSSIIRPRCNEKSIRFETRFDDFSPSFFLLDSLRLRQVLINLLGNAVKFTPECGVIQFCIENLGRENGRAHARFVVKDNGIGVPKEHQKAIFQAFEQGGGSQASRQGGTGLGLAISRRIVELFGGDIKLKSHVGEGSCFSFDIWMEETAAELPGAQTLTDATGRFAGRRLLLVDDVEINRMLVVSMLEETGIEVDEAGDGQAAVERFAAMPQGTYDIILMDVTMPVMNGYEATAAIRALDRPDAKQVPIVALTANAFKEDIDNALAQGMNAHVAKPIELDTLLEVLFRFLGDG